MTTANAPYYEIKQELTPQQRDNLIDYLDYRSTGERLSELVQGNQKFTPVLYRGIHYPLKKLQIGMTYQHFEPLSSWSTEFEVARTFNRGTVPLEAFVEEMVTEMGNDLTDVERLGENWEKAYNQFVEVVFEVKNQSGFSVNDFIDHAMYSCEKEFVIHKGEWTIVDVAENYDVHGQRFYLVELE